jgi:hypothetical protein
MFAFLFTGKHAISQINGSLFIKPDNFYAQIYNPGYFRSDEAVAFSFAGFAGASFINQGNFEIADVITLNANNDPRVDFQNFYEASKQRNYIRQDLTLPFLFAMVPFKKGYASFYYNENINTYSLIPQDAVAFLSNGNIPEDYRNFNSEEIKLAGIGYREFAFGYGKPVTDFLNAGIRAKILFGAAQADSKDWNYGIETSPDGEIVTLSAGGTARMMLPVPVNLRENNSIQSVDSENAIAKYFGEYGNPGFAVDLGFSYQKSERHFFSGAIRDLGFIRIRSNSYDVSQEDSFDFVGFDLENAIRYPEEPGYTNSNELVRLIKEEIREVYQPTLETKKYSYMMPVKTVLHYHYQQSARHIFAATSQMSFSKQNYYSVFTLSALQNWANFQVFENLNVHNLNDLSLGGGIRYVGTHAEIFAASDNLIAFYYPAENKTFSLTFGICFLLNHKKDVNEEKFSPRKGKISPYLPFYKDLR